VCTLNVEVEDINDHAPEFVLVWKGQADIIVVLLSCAIGDVYWFSIGEHIG